MKLSEIIDKESIITELRAKDKKGVLEELALAVASREPAVDSAALVRVLLERERLGSTGIGDGVAIPHGKLSGLTQPIISFGRSTQGLDFDSMDGQPAYLFFLLVAPENSTSVHLKALAKIARILRSSAFRQKLMEARTKEELYRAIVETDEE
ncbi:MAG: PTS sugar transporter subunit IIA [Deltaproteobacteria bacterium]|nr:PTS sugar transporter subunit IIA [Deltaproteobacteria bacterium]MBW1950521.1 PTS sugar transporter subunit IIA [Deltaproteobacteria bacterium]MBW2008520.1 PTS sugar transporter subunit IIA [Deltaproteobacteria bacterium]